MNTVIKNIATDIRRQKHDLYQGHFYLDHEVEPNVKPIPIHEKITPLYDLIDLEKKKLLGMILWCSANDVLPRLINRLGEHALWLCESETVHDIPSLKKLIAAWRSPGYIDPLLGLSGTNDIRFKISNLQEQERIQPSDNSPGKLRITTKEEPFEWLYAVKHSIPRQIVGYIDYQGMLSHLTSTPWLWSQGNSLSWPQQLKRAISKTVLNGLVGKNFEVSLDKSLDLKNSLLRGKPHELLNDTLQWLIKAEIRDNLLVFSLNTEIYPPEY